MAETGLARIVARYHGDGRPRVWSLIVTMLGDMVEPHGGSITSRRLQALLGHIGLEPATVRAALSRLASDGWIERRRQGRGGIYSFSETARAQFAEASKRVYAKRKPTKNWSLAVAPEQPHRDAVQVASQTWLFAQFEGQTNGSLPSITGSIVKPQAFALPYHFEDALSLLVEDISDCSDVTGPLDSTAARLLMIHRWRRFILRFPDIPPPVASYDARVGVAECYSGLLAGSQTWLTGSSGGLDPVPEIAASFSYRFDSFD